MKKTICSLKRHLCKIDFCNRWRNNKIAQYQLYERVTDRYLDFALDEEELEQIVQFCQDHFVEKS